MSRSSTPKQTRSVWRAVLTLPLLLACFACGNPEGSVSVDRPAAQAAQVASAAPASNDTEPEIVGSERFSGQVREALLLLKTRDADAYAIVTTYVGRIAEGQRSGMWAYRTPPTYEMSDRTAFYSLTCCAAAIAHDSFHSKLYHDYRNAHAGHVPDAVWTGTAAERQCMKHQLAVMARIGAPKYELDHAKSQADGHYVKDNETWDDYEKRDW
jgi:hypothetical protein